MPDFVDPVALLLDYLRPLVDPVPVCTRVPDPRPVEMVQIRRIGGSARQPVREDVRVDVMVWAETEPRATELGLVLRGALWRLKGTSDLGGVPVYQIETFRGPQVDDDDLTGTPRYWFAEQVTIRADGVTPG